MEAFIPIAVLAVVVIVFLLTHKSIVADLKAKGSADLASLTGALSSAHTAIASLGSSHATAVAAVAAQPLAVPAPVVVAAPVAVAAAPVAVPVTDPMPAVVPAPQPNLWTDPQGNVCTLPQGFVVPANMIATGGGPFSAPTSWLDNEGHLHPFA